MKAKIKNSSKIEYSIKPQEFNVYLNTDEGKLQGVLKVNYISQKIYVDFKRLLTMDERIAVLKEIFYTFCVKYRNNVGDYIEAYSFIDLMNVETDEDAEGKVIIKELIEEQTELDENKKKERLLYNVKWSVNIVRNAVKEGVNEKVLQPMIISSKENDMYKEMLIRVLNMYNIEGYLESLPYLAPHPKENYDSIKNQFYPGFMTGSYTFIYVRQYKFIWE